MALDPSSPTPSMFSKKKKSSIALKSAASYLSAVSQMDAITRSRSGKTTPASTPSLSSTLTSTSESTVLDEYADEDENNIKDGLTLPATPPTSEQVFSTVHSEFGHCANEQFRYESSARPDDKYELEEVEPPYRILLTTYISYIFLICIGHLRDFLGKRLRPANYHHLKEKDVCRFFF